MVQAKCIKKLRDSSNKIYGYRLQDTDGKVLDVKSDALKNAIANKQIEITNLILTSDGKIVSKTHSDARSTAVNERVTCNKVITTDSEIDSAITKARMIGLSVTTIDVEDGTCYYVIHRPEENIIVLIPSNVKHTY